MSSTLYQDSNPGGLNTATNSKKDDQDLLQRIRSRHRYHVQAWKPIRADGEKDIQALSPEGPWDALERANRKKAGRPCIHLDQLTQYTNGFMGEVRQNPMATKVTPAGSGATDKTAE